MTWIGLVVRWHRFELLVLVLGLAVLTVLSGLVVLSATAVVDDWPTCFRPAATASCERATIDLLTLQTRSTGLFDTAAVFSFVIGVALGSPLLAREIETGTAQFVFALVPSRSRWFIARVLPVAFIALTLAALLGVVEELTAQALLPGIDAQSDFSWFGDRGLLAIGHAGVGLAAGLLSGVLLGRVLSAALLAAFICAALAVVFNFALRSWLNSVAILISSTADMSGGVILAGRGDVVLLVPGWRYGEAVAREFASSIAAATVLGLTAMLVLRHRRPLQR